jgi:hypothetical protein
MGFDDGTIHTRRKAKIITVDNDEPTVRSRDRLMRRHSLTLSLRVSHQLIFL